MRETLWLVCLALVVASTSTGCAKQYKAKEATISQPINCATAEGDIRVLQQEKAHVREQIRAGVMSVAPPALIGGLIAGTAKTKAQIATGEYDRMLDEKIAEIRRVCGVK